MTFGREKRLLLGVGALLAPLPLPFNEVVGWPTLIAFLGVAVMFVRRAHLDPPEWLPTWAMNVLGLIYLPVLYLELTVFFRGQLIRPVVHLAMFAVLVKLFALKKERDKWHVVGGLFFLFLTSMATSVHPTIVVYLVAFLAVALSTLCRFGLFSVLARFGYRRGDLAPVPLRGFVWLSTGLSLLAAIPLFAVLPRIQTPYIMARGTGSGTVIHASGFTDVVTLDTIGNIRQNRSVVLRIELEDDERRPPEFRLKAATFDRYDGRTWQRNRAVYDSIRPQAGGFWLSEEEGQHQATIWLNRLNSTALPIPVDASRLSMLAPNLGRDRGGALMLATPPLHRIRYEVSLTGRAVPPLADEVRLGDVDDTALDVSALTPRVAELATQVMGEGTTLERAQRLEGHLATAYEYSVDFVGRNLGEPIEDFLFEYKRGHCEYFASSMVLMLRSQGIPARLATGFLGSEENPLEGYHVVRQSNSHAWVEAQIPGEGWVVFDPTPPAGRPASFEVGFDLLMQQVYDFFIFRWDRYVLTFGLYDQMQIVAQLRRAWRSVLDLFGSDGENVPVSMPQDQVVTGEDSGVVPAFDDPAWLAWAERLGAAIVIVTLVVGIGLWWRSRRPPTVTEVYSRLRDRARDAGLPIGKSTPPLAVGASVIEAFPEASEPTSTLIALYLRESFGGGELGEAERDEARASLARVEQRLPRAS